ncbi:cob(II)yrinic acid a,c-diamide reductase domain protein [Burkholderia pseudomallei MSHR684]|nr:cob(II)yrinic acid a,c-diamide reductase domain protein [Burkholderia pseudomallei MSHR684]
MGAGARRDARLSRVAPTLAGLGLAHDEGGTGMDGRRGRSRTARRAPGEIGWVRGQWVDGTAVQQFSSSAVQQFSSSAVQQFSSSAVQPFNRSTVQPFSRSTVQPFNRSTVQPFNRSAVQPFNRSTVQPFSRPAVQRFSDSAIQRKIIAWHGRSAVRPTRKRRRHAARLVRNVVAMPARTERASGRSRPRCPPLAGSCARLPTRRRNATKPRRRNVFGLPRRA